MHRATRLGPHVARILKNSPRRTISAVPPSASSSFFLAIRVVRDTMLQLMDTMPDPKPWIASAMAGLTVPGVLGIEKCFARKTGLKWHVDLHLEVDPAMSVYESHEIATRVKEKIRSEVDWVADVLVHVEPHMLRYNLSRATAQTSRMENREFARVLAETADLMEIAGEDGFRIRSYRNAASAIEGYPERVDDILAQPRAQSHRNSRRRQRPRQRARRDRQARLV